MKRAASALFLFAAAVAAGLGCAELLYRWPAARELIARVCGRGDLVAVVDGVGIYGADEDAEQLVIAANLRREARHEQVSDAALERELELLRYQYGDPQVFDAELEASGFALEALRERIVDHLRARQWIETQIASELTMTEEESRAFYEANAVRFAQPQRYRVSHLFLAAPPAAPPEVVQAKGDAIKALSKRLTKGEEFAQLIAEASEDEATNERAGDLGFFAAARMPSEFIAEVEKLRPGKPAAPVRLPLGFHILQLTDARSPRQMSFEEVRAEIATHLVNEKRANAVARIRERLTAAEFIRTPL